MKPSLCLCKKPLKTSVLPKLRDARPEASWTCSTLTSSDPTALAKKARQSWPELQDDTRLLMCCISKTLPLELIDALILKAQETAQKRSLPLLGCLAGSLPISNAAVHHSVAFAALRSPDSNVVRAFRSTITGRPKIALGREIRQSLDDERQKALTNRFEKGDFRAAWGTQNHRKVRPPRELNGLLPGAAKEIWLFSDDAPEGLLASLEGEFSAARKLGVISSSTPFINGQPFTLFDANATYSDGAIGAVICSDWMGSGDAPGGGNSVRRRSAPVTWFQGVQPLSEQQFQVTDAQGNIILKLDRKPATRLLLDLIKQQDTDAPTTFYDDKETDYFIGRVLPGTSGPVTDNNLGCTTLYRIVSGDPSKGVMAVQSEDSFAPGDIVELYARSKAYAQPRTSHTTFSLMATSPDDGRQVDEIPTETIIPSRKFHVASENGFICSRGQYAQVCSVEGAVGEL